MEEIMDYRKLILELFYIDDFENNNELLNDYEELKSMNLTGNYDSNEIINIWNKYNEEINEINRLRIKKNNRENIKGNSHGISSDKKTVDMLLNYLVLIMTLRYSKELLDEATKENLATSNDKILYEFLTRIRDKK